MKKRIFSVCLKIMTLPNPHTQQCHSQGSKCKGPGIRLREELSVDTGLTWKRPPRVLQTTEEPAPAHRPVIGHHITCQALSTRSPPAIRLSHCVLTRPLWLKLQSLESQADLGIAHPREFTQLEVAQPNV